MKLNENFWNLLAVCVFGIISMAVIVWILDHPFAYNGDESKYIQTAYDDINSVKENGLRYFLFKEFGQRLNYMTPAFRIFALPVTLFWGPSPYVLRLISWFFFGLTLLFVYWTAKNLSKDKTAGAFAVLFLSISPMMIVTSRLFLTEYPLYLALAMMLYFVFKDWHQPNEHSLWWIGLGIALGLGLLAKISFVFIAVPVIFSLYFLKILQIGPSVPYISKSILLGGLISFSWYSRHLYDYWWSLSHVTARDVRGSFGIHLSFWDKLQMGSFVFSESVAGRYLFVLIAVVMIIFMLRIKDVNRRTILAVGICLLSIIPTIFITITGTNNNSRYLAPTLIPLAIAFGVMALEVKRLSIRWPIVFVTGIMLFQLFYMIVPSGVPQYKKADNISQKLMWGNLSTVFEREDQWNWDSLKRLCDQRQIKAPVIRLLGNGLQFKSYHIKYPWLRCGQQADVATRIWRFENGEINWDNISKRIQNSDVVLTIPNFMGYIPNKDNIDNRHNNEFVERLKIDPRFEGPVVLKLGRFDPKDVYVFFRKANKITSQVLIDERGKL